MLPFVTDFTYEVEIPFIPNTGRRCAPACAGMALKVLMPELAFSQDKVEQECGFREGHSTWAAQHLLWFDELGLEVGWIQDDDLDYFTWAPFEFIRHQVPNEAAYQEFTAANDISTESTRIKEYLQRGLPFERRKATIEDIRQKALGGYIVRLDEINGKALAERPGHVGHAVLVSAFNDEVVRLENPDGLHGSKPKQLVPWEALLGAWPNPAMQYYRKPVEI